MNKFNKTFLTTMKLFENMDCSSVLGSSPHLTNEPYAIKYGDDARLPKVLGGKKRNKKGKKTPLIQKRPINYA